MKHLFRILPILVALLVSLLMTACGPIYQTTYEYIPPKSHQGRMCANRCLDQKSMCQNNCSMLNQSCRMQANAAAEPAYRQYLKQTRKQGETPWRTLSDFADYSACDDHCACMVNYNQCFVNCGGHVIPHTVCTAFCDKIKK